MDKIKENIVDISNELAEKLGYFVIDVIIRGDSRKRILEVFVDAEKNVSADDLAEMSRELNEIIESENLIKESYRLEVSSPGVDRPLKFLKQYPKHINRKFEVVYKSADSEEKFTGKLIAVERDLLTFQEKEKNILIKFNQIITAKVLISFS
jgi:ribosome maturation factor RimP